MSIIENKEDMISYFKLKKKIEKNRDVPKLRINLSKMAKIGKKFILCAF